MGSSETRLTVPKTCHGFIADSLFSATLMGRAGQRWRSQGFLGSQMEQVVSNMDPDSVRSYINYPAPTNTYVGTIQHHCYGEGVNGHVRRE